MSKPIFFAQAVKGLFYNMFCEFILAQPCYFVDSPPFRQYFRLWMQKLYSTESVVNQHCLCNLKGLWGLVFQSGIVFIHNLWTQIPLLLYINCISALVKWILRSDRGVEIIVSSYQMNTPRRKKNHRVLILKIRPSNQTEFAY